MADSSFGPNSHIFLYNQNAHIAEYLMVPSEERWNKGIYITQLI